MISQLLISLALALPILAGPFPAMARQTPAARTAPLGAAARETDRLAAEERRLEDRRAQKLAGKSKLAGTYEAQLRELDRLKRGKASWRRDRQIRSSQAESQTTAELLSRADADLRTIDGQLRRQREALRTAIDREIALGPDASRRAQLGRMRAQVAAELRPPARRILVPDATLDELADPAELAEQIALIRQAEAELRSEGEKLRRSEEVYARMAALRAQSARAKEMSDFDDDIVRRGGRAARDRPSTTSGDGASAPEDTSGAGNPPPAGSEDGNDGSAIPEPSSFGARDEVGEDSRFEQSSILLADVVDSNTASALRRAGQSSSSPKARAEAAAGARRQVEARLKRLEQGRALIELHLSRLRKGR